MERIARWRLHEQLSEFSQVSQGNVLGPINLSHYISVTGGSGGESKAKRKQNVVPVQIQEILEAPEEGFTVEGQEVGMVLVVGKVTDCEKATTKTTYRVSQQTFLDFYKALK